MNRSSSHGWRCLPNGIFMRDERVDFGSQRCLELQYGVLVSPPPNSPLVTGFKVPSAVVEIHMIIADNKSFASMWQRYWCLPSTCVVAKALK